MSLNVLVFAAHPDDAELNCGGTIAALKNQGKSVGIVDLTQGEMGTRGTIETRNKEARAASKILSIDFREQLNIGDSIIDNNRVNQLKIIAIVRHHKPLVCITGAPDDRHPDHGKATRLCIDAFFYSGLRKIDSYGLDGELQEAWRPKHILHYMQDRPFEPDFIFDISDFWETKQKAILAYKTQFNNNNESSEPATYISTQNYFKQLEARARYFGHLAGFTFGEPFQYLNGPLGLQNFDPFTSE
jgi:bacillithiol biosynthesis deacetylase BshB1